MSWGIKNITIVGLASYSVGFNNIVEIKNVSDEYSDHTDFIFECYDKDGRILKRIINCPIDVTYGDEL